MILGQARYDPAAAVLKDTSAPLAMTTLDPINLRVTFTAPPSGKVVVRTRLAVHGAATVPQVLVGIKQGATVIARRSAAWQAPKFASSTGINIAETYFPIAGLTPGATYTWDLAYGVETGVASTNIKYGGPDDAVANNAFGPASITVLSAPALLAVTNYDPAVAVSFATVAAAALAALDTTNLRLAFTAPESGDVMAEIRGVLHGATGPPQIFLGIKEGAATVARQAPGKLGWSSALATSHFQAQTQMVVRGLTPGQTYTWDAAMGVETGIGSTGLKCGGPDNAVADDAWGAFLFAIWGM